MAIQQPQTASIQVVRRLCTLLLCAVVIYSAGCKKEDPPQRIIPETADQTILFYIPGRSLYTYYQRNIQEIRQAIGEDILGNSRVLVCYQPDKQTELQLVEIFYDPATRTHATTQLAIYKDFTAADPVSVSRMFTEAAKAAPARKYGLVVGCHGKGWVPVGKYLRSYSQQAEDEYWKRVGDKMTRSFGDSGYEIDTDAFAAVLENLSFRFDYLMFDACFMANIETLYDLRKSVDYIVAAPCEVLAHGFPYSRILPALLTNQGASYDLQRACEAFYNFYEYDWNSVPGNAQSGCISLTVTAEIDALATLMKEINATPKKTSPLALQYYEGLSEHLFYDLGHWVNSAFNDQELLARFAVQFDKAFPKTSRLHTGAFYSAYNDQMNPVTYYSGISISEPSTKYRMENQATAWYRATH